MHQPHPGPDSSISLDPQISNTFMIKAYILFAVTLYLIHDFIKKVHKPGIIWITNAFICIIYVGYAVHWTEDRANWVSMQYMYIIFLNKSEKVYRIFFILIVHTVKVVIYAMGKITQVTQYKSCIWAKNKINVFCTTLNFKFFYIPMHWDTCILTFFLMNFDFVSRYVILDTPGQIEVFTWSASGTIITETLVRKLYSSWNAFFFSL